MWTLIPQLFYDFLARIVPGAILLLGLVLVIFGPSDTATFLTTNQAVSLFSPYHLLLVILISYFTGLIAGRLFEVSIGLMNAKRYDLLEERCREECLAEHNKLLCLLNYPPLTINPADLPRDFVIRDHLRIILPTQVPRLLKIRAERRLCQVLMVGFILLFIMNLFYYSNSPSERRLLAVFFALAFWVCWINEQRLHRYLLTGTLSLWLMQTSPGQSPLPKSDEKH
ncbi:hypothetical protein [Desulfobacca acetoxidans]|jgi:hypothetical protein|uniref:Uncharacterized protein n=1 Tax=Desulfobacca acetoxidans (strain ATCC 700848 / DSM 11109 / ASRB2) TaxID=880072 RepID=F2NJ42_DESAR|nr:hypothetical protein [Desulfobacca acetoxidans]AEB08000.1 hypothetical protein Desac_0102 [Desulfobacca acetoxidans DSM 11109]HAY22817.1 hypothetical protein [Desulfobacterales bacterium]